MAKRRVAGRSSARRKGKAARSGTVNNVNDIPHGEALVVGDTAARANKFDAEKRRLVLDAMLSGRTVGQASGLAGVSPVTVFLTRKRDRDFGRAFDEARDVGTDMVDDELWAGALHGKKINFHAVIAILNSRRPELYRQNMKVEHSGHVATSDALRSAYDRLGRDGDAKQEPRH